MGAERTSALVTQIGRLDSPIGRSKPIQQVSTTLVVSPKPIQQIGILQTAKEGLTEFSKPIQQVGIIKFNADTVTKIIEQVDLSPEVDGYDGIIEQKQFTSIVQAQQFITSTHATNNRIMEQKPVISNNVTVTQFDFIDFIFPPCGSIRNPVDTDILWRIKDTGFPLNVSTVVFKVEGIAVQDTSDFVITPITNGLQLEYFPPANFPFGAEISVYLEVDDTASIPNTIVYFCNWFTVEDTRPPQIVNVIPECNSTGVDTLTAVEFDVIDNGWGVDLDSITLSIEGLVICSGISFDAISVASGTGYHVVYEHPNEPFRFDSEVTISIEAQDVAPEPNKVLFVCFFTTLESSAPEFINFDPEICETFVDNRTGLTFEVYGVEHGVDISTLEVIVDQKLRKVYVRPRILRTE